MLGAKAVIPCLLANTLSLSYIWNPNLGVFKMQNANGQDSVRTRSNVSCIALMQYKKSQFKTWVCMCIWVVQC